MTWTYAVVWIVWGVAVRVFWKRTRELEAFHSKLSKRERAAGEDVPRQRLTKAERTKKKNLAMLGIILWSATLAPVYYFHPTLHAFLFEEFSSLVVFQTPQTAMISVLSGMAVTGFLISGGIWKIPKWAWLPGTPVPKNLAGADLGTVFNRMQWLVIAVILFGGVLLPMGSYTKLGPDGVVVKKIFFLPERLYRWDEIQDVSVRWRIYRGSGIKTPSCMEVEFNLNTRQGVVVLMDDWGSPGLDGQTFTQDPDRLIRAIDWMRAHGVVVHKESSGAFRAADLPVNFRKEAWLAFTQKN